MCRWKGQWPFRGSCEDESSGDDTYSEGQGGEKCRVAGCVTCPVSWVGCRCPGLAKKVPDRLILKTFIEQHTFCVDTHVICLTLQISSGAYCNKSWVLESQLVASPPLTICSFAVLIFKTVWFTRGFIFLATMSICCLSSSELYSFCCLRSVLVLPI